MRDIIYSLELSYRASRDSEGFLRLAGGPCSLEELAHFCAGRTSNVLITGRSSLRLAESVVSLKVLSSQIKFDPESIYRTLAKIRPPFSARSLGLLGDWAFNRERRVLIRIYAHPRPQIEVYTALWQFCINLLYFHFIDNNNVIN